MTPYQQHYAIYMGICFLIIFFFYSYHNPNLSSMQIIYILMFGFIAAIATFITQQYINKEEILPKHIESFAHIFIFIFWIWILRFLAKIF